MIHTKFAVLSWIFALLAGALAVEDPHFADILNDARARAEVRASRSVAVLRGG